MYYQELSKYKHHKMEHGLNIFNVGWIDKEHEYEKGSLNEEFSENLFLFCACAVYSSAHYHVCPFCDDGRCGIKVERNGEVIIIGGAEIRVPGKWKIYAAPNLIYHYVTEHNYLPPQEFIEAVIRLKPCKMH